MPRTESQIAMAPLPYPASFPNALRWKTSGPLVALVDGMELEKNDDVVSQVFRILTNLLTRRSSGG